MALYGKALVNLQSQEKGDHVPGVRSYAPCFWSLNLTLVEDGEAKLLRADHRRSQAEWESDRSVSFDSPDPLQPETREQRLL